MESVAAYQTGEGARGQTGVGVPFPDLAYTLFVEQRGRVALAHRLVIRVWHNSAWDPVHGHGRNRTRIGICYAGNRKPTDAQLLGLAQATVWCEQQLGRKLEINGHKDTNSTRCPGEFWPEWKTDIERLIKQLRS